MDYKSPSRDIHICKVTQVIFEERDNLRTLFAAICNSEIDEFADDSGLHIEFAIAKRDGQQNFDQLHT